MSRIVSLVDGYLFPQLLIFTAYLSAYLFAFVWIISVGKQNVETITSEVLHVLGSKWASDWASAISVALLLH